MQTAKAAHIAVSTCRPECWITTHLVVGSVVHECGVARDCDIAHEVQLEVVNRTIDEDGSTLAALQGEVSKERKGWKSWPGILNLYLTLTVAPTTHNTARAGEQSTTWGF